MKKEIILAHLSKSLYIYPKRVYVKLYFYHGDDLEWCHRVKKEDFFSLLEDMKKEYNDEGILALIGQRLYDEGLVK